MFTEESEGTKVLGRGSFHTPEEPGKKAVDVVEGGKGRRPNRFFPNGSYVGWSASLCLEILSLVAFNGFSGLLSLHPLLSCKKEDSATVFVAYDKHSSDVER